MFSTMHPVHAGPHLNPLQQANNVPIASPVYPAHFSAQMFNYMLQAMYGGGVSFNIDIHAAV